MFRYDRKHRSVVSGIGDPMKRNLHAIVMGRNIERNLDFRDRVREYSSKSGIRLLKAQDIKK